MFFAFVRWSLFVVRFFTCCCLLFVVRCLLFVVHCSLFIVHCSFFVVRSVHQFDASGIVTQRTIDEDGRWWRWAEFLFQTTNIPNTTIQVGDNQTAAVSSLLLLWWWWWLWCVGLFYFLGDLFAHFFFHVVLIVVCFRWLLLLVVVVFVLTQFASGCEWIWKRCWGEWNAAVGGGSRCSVSQRWRHGDGTGSKWWWWWWWLLLLWWGGGGGGCLWLLLWFCLWLLWVWLLLLYFVLVCFLCFCFVDDLWLTRFGITSVSVRFWFSSVHGRI